MALFKAVQARAICTVVSTYPAGLLEIDFMNDVVTLAQRAAENKNGALVIFPVTLLSTLGSLMTSLPLALDANISLTFKFLFANIPRARLI